MYDRMMSGSEKAGLRDYRRDILKEAQGRTLEIGSGIGHNLDLYPDAVTELVLTEPNPHMAKRLRAAAQESGRAAEVLEAPGEKLPLPDSDFDTVVLTLVLCTVKD